MNLKNTDTDLVLSDWKSVLLRFFYLSTGNQQAAENLTIEILVEYQSLRADRSGRSLVVCLLSRAVQRAKTIAIESSGEVTDPLVKALSKLSWEKRTVAILIGALSLNSVLAGEICGLERRIVGLFALEAFTELRQELLLIR